MGLRYAWCRDRAELSAVGDAYFFVKSGAGGLVGYWSSGVFSLKMKFRIECFCAGLFFFEGSDELWMLPGAMRIYYSKIPFHLSLFLRSGTAPAPNPLHAASIAV